MARIAHIARGSWRCREHQVPWAETIQYTFFIAPTRHPTSQRPRPLRTSLRNHDRPSLVSINHWLLAGLLVFPRATDSPHSPWFMVLQGTPSTLRQYKQYTFSIAPSRLGHPTSQRPMLLQIYETTTGRPSATCLNKSLAARAARVPSWHR